MYKTIVVDLKSGRILHVGQGKVADAWAGFWKRGRRKKLDIKHIATDLSAAFISSVLENCPNAVHVFDHFHVVKLMNEKLDEIRRDINKRKVLRGRATCCCAMERISSIRSTKQGLTMPWI